MANPVLAWWARLPRAQRVLLGGGVPVVGIAALLGRRRRPSDDEAAAESEPEPAPTGAFAAPGVGGFIAANELGAFASAFTEALSGGLGDLQEQVDELRARSSAPLAPVSPTPAPRPIITDPIPFPGPPIAFPVPYTPPVSRAAPVSPVPIPYTEPVAIPAPIAPAATAPIQTLKKIAPATTAPGPTTTTAPSRVIATSIGQGIIASTTPLKTKTLVVF